MDTEEAVQILELKRSCLLFEINRNLFLGEIQRAKLNREVLEGRWKIDRNGTKIGLVF
jgi:hypothetical protein